MVSYSLYNDTNAIDYSHRHSFDEMTANFSEDVIENARNVSGLDGPPPENNPAPIPYNPWEWVNRSAFETPAVLSSKTPTTSKLKTDSSTSLSSTSSAASAVAARAERATGTQTLGASRMRGGATAGIAIGGILGFLALLGLVLYFLRQRKTSPNTSTSLIGDETHESDTKDDSDWRIDPISSPMHDAKELEDTHKRELEAREWRAELAADHCGLVEGVASDDLGAIRKSRSLQEIIITPVAAASSTAIPLTRSIRNELATAEEARQKARKLELYWLQQEEAKIQRRRQQLTGNG